MLTMRSRKGFTLIELLIVVVIIGILASIAIPKFHNSKEQAYIASMRSDMQNLATAEEAYYSDHTGIYAANTAALGTAFNPSPGVTIQLVGLASSWRATAKNPMTTVSCRLAANTNKSYDGAVLCK
jgi:type IV pilus assembly protein PilA